MSDPIELPLEDNDRLYEPPLVDTIYYDDRLRGYSVHFVPNDAASSEPTELVFVPESSPHFALLKTYWDRLEQLCDHPAKLVRIVHGGGAEYTCHFADLEVINLSALSTTEAIEAIDRLKQIADTAEIVFLDHRYRRTA